MDDHGTPLPLPPGTKVREFQIDKTLGQGSFGIVYTRGYATPEQLWSGEEQGPWTDIYALGATLYRLITGEPPQGFSRTSLQEDYKGKYSPGFLAAIDTALEPKSADRPQTIGEWRTWFESSTPQRRGVDGPTALQPVVGPADETRVVVPDAASAGDPTELTPETRAATYALIEGLTAEFECARIEASLSPDRVLALSGHLNNERDLAVLRDRLLGLEHVEPAADYFASLAGLLNDARASGITDIAVSFRFLETRR